VTHLGYFASQQCQKTLKKQLFLGRFGTAQNAYLLRDFSICKSAIPKLYPANQCSRCKGFHGDKAMALFSNILDRRSRNRSVTDLGSMTDRQLEDLGLCRADIRQSKQSKIVWPNRPNEAWPSL